MLTLPSVALQAKKKFLAWADSEAGIEVSPDVDLFHAFAEVRMASNRFVLLPGDDLGQR